MFDFSNSDKPTPKLETNMPQMIQVDKLDLATLLEHIDIGDYQYFDSLSDDAKSQFQPYTALRWVSSLDDSLLVTFNSKRVESVFGSWKQGGKEALNELVDACKSNGIKVSSVSKYEHAKYDWRIKFAVGDTSSANKFIEEMKQFGITGAEIVSLVDTTTAKYHLIMLNEMVNVGFWDMKNHPELIYQLLCSVSEMVGKEKRTHNWLPFPKGLKNVNREIFDIIKKTQPETISTQMNEAEYRILLLSYDKKTFGTLLEEMGFQPNESKPLLKLFKEECEKYGKES